MLKEEMRSTAGFRNESELNRRSFDGRSSPPSVKGQVSPAFLTHGGLIVATFASLVDAALGHARYRRHRRRPRRCQRRRRFRRGCAAWVLKTT